MTDGIDEVLESTKFIDRQVVVSYKAQAVRYNGEVLALHGDAGLVLQNDARYEHVVASWPGTLRSVDKKRLVLELPPNKKAQQKFVAIRRAAVISIRLQ
jgi:hypothetical protein